MNILQETLKNLTLGPAASFAGLTLFPLLAERKDERGYLTLDDALAMGTLKITEMSNAGNVPELLLHNEGKEPVLLLDGEELTGAKQNRVLNLTVLAPAGAKIVISVACVEAGRWSARSEYFAVADRVMFSGARMNKVAAVSHAFFSENAPRSDQRQVWDDITLKSNDCDIESPTSEMGAIYRANARKINDYVRAFQPVPDQVGAVFALASRIRGMELFDHHRTLCDLLPKLIRSYALDAMEIASSTHALPTEDDAKTFLADMAASEHTEHDAVGMGKDLRLSGGNLAGGALVVEEQVVHLCAFRDESDGMLHRDPQEQPDFEATRHRIREIERRRRSDRNDELAQDRIMDVYWMMGWRGHTS